MNTNFIKFKLIKNSKNPTEDWKKDNRKTSFKKYSNHNYNNYNLGIPTGKKYNNIMVIDLDTYKWNDNHIFYLDLKLKELISNTYTVKTPRGGYHLYYIYDEEISQTQNEIYQIDIRSDGGYIVDANSIINGSKYEIINNTEIINIPNNFKQFILDHIIKKKVIKKKNNNNNNKMIIGDNILNNLLNDNTIKNIINNLDNKYWNGYNNFLLFTSFMKTLNKQNLWDEINKTKNNYNYDNNIKIWNSCHISHNFIVNVLKDYDDNILNYYFYKPIMKNIIKPNKILRGNNKQGFKKLGYNFFDDKHNYIIKSDTGTGKTTSFKHYIKNTNKNFISIVSRISLGEEQYYNFSNDGINCKLYNIENNFNNKDNIIITVDSLLRLKNINFNKYVIFIDEYNSVIEYLITSSTLNNKRTSIYNMFIKILNNCNQYIGTDADINDISLSFLKYCNKDYYYVKNIYKHNKGVKAEEIHNLNDFINDIKKQDKYLICCDSKKNVELINNLLKDNEVKIITSETDEYIKFDDYDKIIYSPKIIYGIDSSINRNVYCFYKEHTITPQHMIQQISRCRNIKNLKFLFLKKKLIINNLSLEEVKEEIIKEDKYGSYEFEINCSEIVNEQYLKLLTLYEYNNYCYNTNKFSHFLKLLNDRGFILNNNLYNTNKKDISTLLNNLKQIKLDNFDKNNKYVIKINKYLKIPDNEIENYKEYFIDDNLLKNHFNICKLLYNSIDELKDNLNNKDEFNSKKTINNNMKIIYIHKILNTLNCKYNELFNIDINITTDMRNKLFDEYNIIFRNRNKKKNFNNDYDFKIYLSKIYKQLFGNNIIITNRNNKTKNYNYKINNEYLNNNIKLYNFRNIKYEYIF
jgi:hypothetical protein